jgi:hypothetical protein
LGAGIGNAGKLAAGGGHDAFPVDPAIRKSPEDSMGQFGGGSLPTPHAKLFAARMDT